MNSNASQTLSFRLSADRVEELDSVAERTGRVRSNLLTIGVELVMHLEEQGKLDKFIRAIPESKRGRKAKGKGVVA